MSQAALRLSAPTAVNLVDGDFPLSAKNFRAIATMLREQSGIYLPDAKATLVYSRLSKRLRALKLDGFDAYCALLASPAGAEERSAMLAALTTNVTRFYREPHHFDHLGAFIGRNLAAKARAGGRVRIWSSACSTGEEAYSIALTVLSQLPEAASLDVKVLATDIDPVVVARARAGLYRRDAVAPAPAILRERYFTPCAADAASVSAGDELRRLITFKELNLIGEWPMRGKFDAIFCRNVVIYFEDETQARLWKRFAGCLASHGRLYVGHSERVDDPHYASDGLTVYRVSGARS